MVPKMTKEYDWKASTYPYNIHNIFKRNWK